MPTRVVYPIARLAPGVNKTAAEQQLQNLQLQLAAENRDEFPQEPFTSQLTNYLDVTAASGEMKQSLELLFGAVGFLLLIACANVASLQLARGSSRVREMAVRLSLGAPRGRIVRQLLTESVLLSGTGGLLGLAFAFAITRLMVTLMPDFNVPNEARIEVNGIVLLFCTGVSVLTGVVFGLVPALQSSRPNVTDALKDEAWGASAMVGGKTRAALVVTEVALSVMLLVSAGMTIRAFVAVQQVELGFEPEHVVVANLILPPNRYDSPEKLNRFTTDLLASVQALPGVLSASIGNGALPFGGLIARYAIDGVAAAPDRRVLVQLASAGYLRTLGIPLREGRSFTESDLANASHVAVINEAAAKLWAGDNPIGRVIRIDVGRADASPEVTVIGVFADARNLGLRRDIMPAAMLPFTLMPLPGRALAIRTLIDPGALMSVVRARVREMDPEVPIRGPHSLLDALDADSIQPRFTMSLFTLFAALGLALAMAGIYSVLSHLVELRTREVGVRMALGAERGNVLGMFMRTGARLVGVGLAVGLVGSLGLERLLSSRLDLSRAAAFDPLTIALTVLLLAAVAACACYVPARRATRVDPMVALRRS
jgi:putative ABC transport system permease protein